MTDKLVVSFSAPSHGWIEFMLVQGGAILEGMISDLTSAETGVPPLEDLCGALSRAISGFDARPAVLWGEPHFHEFWFEAIQNSGGCALFVLHRPGNSGSPNQKPSEVFRYSGTVASVVLPFWRALKRLEAKSVEPEFQENWKDGFPTTAMAALTEQVAALRE